MLLSSALGPANPALPADSKAVSSHFPEENTKVGQVTCQQQSTAAAGSIPTIPQSDVIFTQVSMATPSLPPPVTQDLMDPVYLRISGAAPELVTPARLITGAAELAGLILVSGQLCCQEVCRAQLQVRGSIPCTVAAKPWHELQVKLTL